MSSAVAVCALYVAQNLRKHLRGNGGKVFEGEAVAQALLLGCVSTPKTLWPRCYDNLL